MTQTSTGFLTIGIPTYNGAFNFNELFSSIKNLGLNENEYEILVVDNASTDNTLELLEFLKNEYSNLRYYQNQRNIGRTENWDKIVELAKGEYLILMNVNDRFLKFELRKYLTYLDNHKNISMVLANIHIVYPESSHLYPNFKECGIINLTNYLAKTFLDPKYIEFNSLGILHQHVFRREIITGNNIKFDNRIPRTTDRVFVGEVINAAGGLFYYTNETLVKWQINNYRFHHNVHLNNRELDLDYVWMNEYKANKALAKLGKISSQDFLWCQLVFAKFFILKYKMTTIARRFSISIPPSSLDEISAHIYYDYIKVVAKLNGILLNETVVTFTALFKVLRLPLQKLKIISHERSIKDIIAPVSIN